LNRTVAKCDQTYEPHYFSKQVNSWNICPWQAFPI
jgi:hypothetical protein